jgi:hypothetical protein
MISPSDQLIEIYARGTDGQLYEKYWSASTSWSEYIPLAGSLTSGVSATAWDANRRDVFSAVPTARSGSVPGPTPWVRAVGAPRRPARPGATAPALNRLLAFVRDRQRVTFQSFSSTWSGFHDFGYAPPPPRRRPSAPARRPTRRCG